MALPPWTAAASLVPSADEAIAAQFVMGALVCTQLAPELVEVHITAGVSPSPFAAAASLVPSPEQAIDRQEFEGALVTVHVIPPSPDVNIGAPCAPNTPEATATILVPSAEQATACHDTLLDATLHCQVAPEFVETYIEPFSGGLVNSAVRATSRVPSADEAIDVQ